MLIIRKQLKDWFLSPWPDRDLDYHFSMCEGINRALREKALTQHDLMLVIRYLCGYVDNAEEETVKRTMLVIAAYVPLMTNEQYVRSVLRHQPETVIQAKIAACNAVSLWE